MLGIDAEGMESEDEEMVTGSQVVIAKTKLMKRARIEVDHLEDRESLVFFI